MTTANTEIRHLHPTFRKELANVLDLNDGWKHLASIITRTDKDTEPLYTDEHLKLFASIRGSPTLHLLDDWGTRGIHRPTIQILINNLIKVDQYRAADYLAVVVLKGKTLERPTCGVAAPIHVSQYIPKDVYSTTEATNVGHVPTTENSTANSELTAHPATREPEQETPGTEAGKKYNGSVNFKAAIQKSLVAAGSDSNPGLAIPHIDFGELFKGTLGFSKNQKLGQGGFGAVYLGILDINGTKKNVAVKRLNIGEEEQFRTELHVMTRYIHENLLQILAFSCDNPQGRCLICAYMSNGSLEDRLAQKNNTPPLQWKTRLNIAVGTARGLVALHTMHAEELVHRDIKSANILLDGNLNAKIGDFGIARLGSDWKETTRMLTSKWCGTPVYMAEEALRGSVTVKMDTFSFGVVLLELLTGLPPFDNSRSAPDLLSYVDEEEKEVNEWKDPKAGEWPENVAAALFQLATRCTEPKMKLRPLMEEILPELEVLQQEITNE